MARKAAAQKEPTISPDRALRAVTQQLDELQKLKNRNYEEADAEETEWMHLTQNIIEAAFGADSSNLHQFYSATHAGDHNAYGIDEEQQQNNFVLRIKEFEALLRALISALRLQLPEEEIQGAYEPGEEYAFYRDLSSIVETATNDIFIVDPYLDEKIFNLYVDKVPAGATVRILSNKIGANVQTVATMYSKNRPLEMRSSAGAHDRAIFIDRRGWVVGQSIKDAARKKPTYLVELGEPSVGVLRDAHNQIWTAATVVV
jgi:hypothetical protein